MLCFKVQLNGQEPTMVGVQNPLILHVALVFSSKLGDSPTISAFAQSDESRECRITKHWFDLGGNLQVGDSVQIEVVDSPTADEGQSIHREGRRIVGGKVELYCNFCGKNNEEVDRIIPGPNVYICNECVQLCNEILAEEPGKG